jgi:hypothetical protein
MPRLERSGSNYSDPVKASIRGPQRPEIVEINASNGADEKPPIAPNGSLVYLSNEVSSCGALMPRIVGCSPGAADVLSPCFLMPCLLACCVQLVNDNAIGRR